MRIAGVAAGIALAVALTACSSSGGGKAATSGPPASISSSASPTASASPKFDRAAAQAAITKNWEAFFSKKTPVAAKIGYLEKGATLKAAVQRFGSDPRTKQASAKVTSVFVSSPTAATVNYQVLLGGTVALPNAVGTAVQENGVWKVSDSTLCGLLGLLGTAKVPGC